MRLHTILGLSLFLGFAGKVFSADIDLFVKEVPSNQRGVVVFIMDTSGSMGVLVDSGGGLSVTRMDVAKAALSRFILSAKNINIALASFSWEGGKIDFPSQNVETGRQTALNVNNNYVASGGTPLVGSLYEIYRYLGGFSRQFDNGQSTAGAFSGSNYRSPIVNQCQKSNVILFTDGAGWATSNVQQAVRNLVSGHTLPAGLDRNCWSGDCLDEMSWYMRNRDVRPGITGNQHTTTYTIAGFGSAPPGILRTTASFGGGQYYDAAGSEDLDNALADIMARVRAEESSFTAPATSTSAFNSLETAEDLYYVMFKPGEGSNWKGNLKRYRLGEDNQIYDANNQLAIDPDTGFFKDTARSFWSSTADGKSVEQGGMAANRSQSAPAYTNISGDNNVNLTTFTNKLHESNSGITQSMLGVLNSTDRQNMLRWARGVDVDDENTNGSTTDDRHSIADPIHAQPKVISYFSNDKTIFFTTNSGFLYGVNADNGSTELSFIPKDLLTNLAHYRGIDKIDNGKRVTETFRVTEESGIFHSMIIDGIGNFPENIGTVNKTVRPGQYQLIYNGGGTIGSLTQPQIRVVNGGRTVEITDGGGSWDDYRMTVERGYFGLSGLQVTYVLPDYDDVPASAPTYSRSINPRLNWNNTGINIQGPVRLVITVTGQVQFGCPCIGYPNGNPEVEAFGNRLDPRFANAAVLARIGGGEPFFVGSYFDGVVESSGTLEFTTNDVIRHDDSGTFSASISLDPDYDTRPKKFYGLDGPIAVWTNDANGNGRVLQSNNGSPESGEHVYLYLSMRRGGNNIYAMDVTRRNSPVLKWVIRGDVDNNHISDPYGDFGRLGQTWSEPKLARVKWNGGERQVLLFGGGYDVAVDNQSTIQNNNIGNAVFMVDAETGALLWRASNNDSNLNMSDMRYSIPAGLAVIDVDQDGFTDYFYAVDMGGQIIRFDVNQTNSGSRNFARGGVIARISGTSSGDARRFFETPDVSISSTFDYLNIAIGTGLRHSPLNTSVNDRMYVIRDPHIFEPPADYTYVGNSVITESSLYDATANLIQQGSTTQKEAALNNLNNSNGWYIRLEESGEKILSRPKIFSGILLFNSFALNTTNVNECLPNPGVNYTN
ncbi:PilC/PilY family type IV pilus protein [Endozoicomonas atrinae]|uniref:PilC/PilY family type IV pilus protein n=1 Tax=Endozoicomonas atrinae TaxID=1333660 RepID=UPI000ADB2CD9|nr:PilC/PilY family type IV pilus protein [Endozoicomonas atrinae]